MTAPFTVRSPAVTVLSLAGSFAGALAMGYLLAFAVGPLGDLRVAIAVFGQLLIFFVGYKLWATYAIGLIMGRFGHRLLRALLAGLTGREADFRAGVKAELETLRDPAYFAEAIEKIRKRASVFPKIGVLFGLTTGSVLGLLGTGAGFAVTVILFSGAGWAYGALLGRLAASGYLPLPESS